MDCSAPHSPHTTTFLSSQIHNFVHARGYVLETGVTAVLDAFATKEIAPRASRLTLPPNVQVSGLITTARTTFEIYAIESVLHFACVLAESHQRKRIKVLDALLVVDMARLWLGCIKFVE